MSKFSDAVLALSPTSYWRFEGASPLADSGSAGITLTATGSPTRVPSLIPVELGADENAYRLNGVTMWLQAGDVYDFSTGQDWTIILWEKLETDNFGSGVQRIIEKRDQTGNFPGYLMYGSTVSNITSDHDPGAAAPEGFTEANLVHRAETNLLCWRWDASATDWALYRNGSFVGSKNSWTVTPFAASTASFTIGATSGGSAAFGGVVDDVAVWDGTALSAAEILDLWEASIYGADVGWLKA